MEKNRLNEKGVGHGIGGSCQSNIPVSRLDGLNHLGVAEGRNFQLDAHASQLSRNETGRLLGISANTTAGYLKNIYRKLNISTRAEAALEAATAALR